MRFNFGKLAKALKVTSERQKQKRQIQSGKSQGVTFYQHHPEATNLFENSLQIKTHI